MENFKYETQGTNTFIVYKVEESEMLDSMTLGMITNNKIVGLAQAFFMQQDNDRYVKYNISSKVSAEQFLMGTVNKKRLIGVFKGIVNAMISAEEYMIDVSSLCLDLDYIYTDVTTCETVVLCLPVIDAEKPTVDLKSFFKNIVFSTQFDQSENGDYIAKLINYLNSASTFSLYDFKEILDEIERGTTVNSVNSQISQPISQSATLQQPSVEYEMPKAQQTSVLPPSLERPAVQPLVQNLAVEEVQSVQVQEKKEVYTQPKKVEIPKKEVATPVSMGFAVPTKKDDTLSKEKNKTETVVASNEKEISWFYLMQHYNKENAAIYKAQQDAKKAAKATAAPEKKDKKEKKEKKAKEPVASAMNAAFAIPGQPAEASKPMEVPAPQSAKPVAPVTPQPVPQVTPAPAAPTPAPQPVSMAQPMGMPANFGETTVLSSAGIGETTVLGASPVMQEIKPYLIRSKNNEKIILDKPVFRIGKEKSYVDYFIGDNTAISRSHANIVQRDGEYFVVDTNSTNHTYVNGGMIQSNVETKISHGAKIRLANEDFEFKLY